MKIKIKDMNSKQLVEMLWKKARFAVNSYSIELVYETKGMVGMCYDLGKIEWSDASMIDHFLIHDSLNNPDWFHKCK